MTLETLYQRRQLAELVTRWRDAHCKYLGWRLVFIRPVGCPDRPTPAPNASIAERNLFTAEMDWASQVDLKSLGVADWRTCSYHVIVKGRLWLCLSRFPAEKKSVEDRARQCFDQLATATAAGLGIGPKPSDWIAHLAATRPCETLGNVERFSTVAQRASYTWRTGRDCPVGTSFERFELCEDAFEASVKSIERIGATLADPPSSTSHEAVPPSTQESDVDAKAAACLVLHPDWTNARIAAEIGTHEKYLSDKRHKKFHAARAARRLNQTPPRGSKLGGDVEASCDDS